MPRRHETFQTINDLTPRQRVIITKVNNNLTAIIKYRGCTAKIADLLGCVQYFILDQEDHYYVMEENNCRWNNNFREADIKRKIDNLIQSGKSDKVKSSKIKSGRGRRK